VSSIESAPSSAHSRWCTYQAQAHRIAHCALWLHRRLR
jgi:hypothetical protein